MPGPRELAMLRILAERRPVESELTGPSMGSTLPGGTRIRIVPLPDGARPRPGQVIAFLAGSRVMVHRVAYLGRSAAARDHLITQGDGNWLCDPPIALAAVAGVVEEAFVAGAWKAVAPPSPSAARRGAAWLSLRMLAAALEASPALAGRIARVLSYGRMGGRLLWSRLVPSARPRNAGN